MRSEEEEASPSKPIPLSKLHSKPIYPNFIPIPQLNMTHTARANKEITLCSIQTVNQNPFLIGASAIMVWTAKATG